MPATVTVPITPKSVLRHRPIGESRPSGRLPEAVRASRPPTNTNTKKTIEMEAIPTWRPAPTEHSAKPLSLREAHWLFTLGLGMIAALLLLLIGQAVAGWVGTTLDDLRYGRPRTFQVDAFVGHEKGSQPSHFMALNLNGRLQVIEFPGGDGTHARIFVGPQLYGPDANLVTVSLQFVPTHMPHLQDMHLIFQNTRLVFHNSQGTFSTGP